MTILAQTKNTFETQIRDLGCIDYLKAYDIQQQSVKDVLKDGVQQLIFCEHPPVLTGGRLAKDKNILIADEDIAKKHVQVVRTDRGGDITLHSPGQLVVYPILDLNHYGRDLHKYLKTLENIIVDLLSDLQIKAYSPEDKTGVWVDEQKIASIGVGCRKWVAFHGIAINVNTDLELFSMIRPCGLDVTMTSIKKLKGHDQPLEIVKNLAAEHFRYNFHLSFQ